MTGKEDHLADCCAAEQVDSSSHFFAKKGIREKMKKNSFFVVLSFLDRRERQVIRRQISP